MRGHLCFLKCIQHSIAHSKDIFSFIEVQLVVTSSQDTKQTVRKMKVVFRIVSSDLAVTMQRYWVRPSTPQMKSKHKEKYFVIVVFVQVADVFGPYNLHTNPEDSEKLELESIP